MISPVSIAGKDISALGVGGGGLGLIPEIGRAPSDMSQFQKKRADQNLTTVVKGIAEYSN